MITLISETYEFRGLSSDDKNDIKYPGNGSVFIEIDTGNIYMYDGENKTWIKQEK